MALVSFHFILKKSLLPVLISFLFQLFFFSSKANADPDPAGSRGFRKNVHSVYLFETFESCPINQSTCTSRIRKIPPGHKK